MIRLANKPRAITFNTEIATDNTFNGKTIYFKRINFGALPNSSTKTTAHGISSIDEVIDLELLVYDGNVWMEAAGLGQSTVSYRIEGTDVVIATANTQSSRDGRVNIWYTKS